MWVFCINSAKRVDINIHVATINNVYCLFCYNNKTLLGLTLNL